MENNKINVYILLPKMVEESNFLHLKKVKNANFSEIFCQFQKCSYLCTRLITVKNAFYEQDYCWI